MTTHEIHPQAALGFNAAGSYDVHRPNYPSVAIYDLLYEIGVSGMNGARIVEIGAGTGKFTELLAARPERYQIQAGEPHAQMRKVLAEKKLSGVTVVADFAENLESVEDGWADAVVIAQAFHWFATPDTLREVRRVLRPNAGGLGLIWNVDDFNAPIDHTPSTSYEARLKAIIRSLPNPINLYRELKWKDVLQSDQQRFFVHPLRERDLAYETAFSRESIWDRFATMSQVSKLEGEELQALKDRVFDALQGEDVVEDAEGKLRYHGRTVWYWTFHLVAAR
ncbi:putative 2-heptaprenyl-1,4-naphthoquinone methyltransferase [Bimuria novae-zelandiae CBS 107.79]|uniref:Putative 2-heptaprenyl-1,4-naphthoquinone methyltransferase n=1 Tax=Bimuria novae-zelandiae CBS 107.79 TaxID=1447943 RepID=A0A6A5VI06_9PLEO|nr:putative 2-heptaprenyl-1,4-naphthoquinone methyltransferase [Bimuria novae-zelandiae CBS 107.79]